MRRELADISNLDENNTIRSSGDRSRMMDDAALERFVSHFERLTRHMLECMPARAHVLVRLDSARAMTLVPAAFDEAREQ